MPQSKPRNGVPTGQEFGQWIVSMAQKSGLTQAEVRQIIGATPSSRNREEITADLRAWLQKRPRQKATRAVDRDA